MADEDLHVALAKSAAMPRQTDADPNLNIELGVERLLPFSHWSADREIANNAVVKIDELVDMRRRDGQARALVRLFVLPILAAFADGEWIAPNTDEEEDGADEEVEYANLMWNLPPQAGGMVTSKMVMLKKHLLALTDGFAVFEEVRDVPTEGPLAGKIVLSDLAYRDSRTIRFRVDEKGRFDGVRQIASVNTTTIDVVIPKEKIFYWAVNEEENPFYGISMFEAAYYHYEIKRKLYYIAHLASQFAAVPGRMGTIPKNADPRDVASFKTGLSNFAFNTAMLMREGFTVAPFNSNSQFDFLKLIDHHNHMMSKSVIAQFLDSDQRAALVEVGRTEDSSADFFVMALESLMDDLAEQWSTDLMPKYIDWNFGTKRYPIFKFGQLSDSDKDTIKDLFNTLVVSSVLNSTPEFVRELEKKISKRLDLDINYEEIEEQEKQAAEEEAQKAELAEEEANQLMNPEQQGQPPAGAPEPAQPPPAEDITQLSNMNLSLDELIVSAEKLLSASGDK